MPIFTMTLKMAVVMALFVPALALSCLIWIFGGWTRGWYDMPNPWGRLVDWGILY